jgi:uncharacterized protein (DUF1684 family)
MDSRRARRSAAWAAAVAAALVACVACVIASGCARREVASVPAPPAAPETVQPQTVAMWRSQFDEHKAQWNTLFQGDDSPLPEAARASFPGQGFYPFAPEWRFVGDLVRNRQVAGIALPDTKGRTQVYWDYGRYPLRVGDRVDTLRVYRPSEHPEQYFIAFTDSTTGRETYGGGRYAHLDSLDTQRFVLDFNQAYNPYCAYDTLWACPLPPRENALPYAVRAGMTKPPGHP